MSQLKWGFERLPSSRSLICFQWSSAMWIQHHTAANEKMILLNLSNAKSTHAQILIHPIIHPCIIAYLSCSLAYSFPLLQWIWSSPAYWSWSWAYSFSFLQWIWSSPAYWSRSWACLSSTFPLTPTRKWICASPFFSASWFSSCSYRKFFRRLQRWEQNRVQICNK